VFGARSASRHRPPLLLFGMFGRKAHGSLFQHLLNLDLLSRPSLLQTLNAILGRATWPHSTRHHAGCIPRLACLASLTLAQLR
jgi:hypothetical protein